jgi:hypothetical protein
LLYGVSLRFEFLLAVGSIHASVNDSRPLFYAPVMVYLVLAGWSMIRGRWRLLATLVGLTVLASIATGAAWLWTDMRAMASIE